MQDLNFIGSVAERDIDLLLLEELHVSVPFSSWFLNHIFGLEVSSSNFIGAWHSVSHVSFGESDLIVLSKNEQKCRKAVLIENKIDAPPQPEQAARYRLHGIVGIEDCTWTTYLSCIIAPQRYLTGTANVAEYDIRLSYESLRDWFRQSDPANPRSSYKARLLNEAIEQNRRGYQPVPHLGVTQFWLDYWHLVDAEYPQLRMKKPTLVPWGSDWAEFRNLELGAKRVIRHKLAEGAVDLEIRSAGEIAGEIAARNRETLRGAFEVVRTGKSASVRAAVPKVDRSGTVADQLEAIRAGLSAAARLLDLSARIDVG